MSHSQKKPIPTDWHKTVYLLTKLQVAQITGYSVKHVEDLVAQGDLPRPVRLAKNRCPRWNSVSIAKAMGITHEPSQY